MSHFRMDDYIMGVAAFSLIFFVVQVALYTARHRAGADTHKH
ncbi:MAG: hypothetical protein WCA09_04925 [Burkholderiales bacterium]